MLPMCHIAVGEKYMGIVIWIIANLMLGLITFYVLPRFRRMSLPLYLFSIFWVSLMGGGAFSLLFMLSPFEFHVLPLIGSVGSTTFYIFVLLLTSQDERRRNFIHTNL